MPTWLENFLPILLLLLTVGIVVSRLPKVDLGHSPEFVRRRFMNWFPLGMTYAFLYMSRYNFTAAKNDLEVRKRFLELIIGRPAPAIAPLGPKFSPSFPEPNEPATWVKR